MQLNVEETLWGRSWVSSKHTHVGDGANQFSVLDDGAAGHALDDAAGGLQKRIVGDVQEEIPAVFPVFGIDFQNFHRILLYVCAGDCRTDHSAACPDILKLGNRKSRAFRYSGRSAEDTLWGIPEQAATDIPAVSISFQQSRVAALSLSDRYYLGMVGSSGGHIQKMSISIVNTMAKSPKNPGFRIVPTDGTDAGDSLF